MGTVSRAKLTAAEKTGRAIAQRMRNQDTQDALQALQVAAKDAISQLATAAREAVTSIATAQQGAASTLAHAASDAAKVVIARQDTGEDWSVNQKYVLSELKRLNDSLEAGLGKVFSTFQTHGNEDGVLFAAIDVKLVNAASDHAVLKVDFATLTERVDHQLWSVYGTMLASLIAILFTLGFHFIK